MLNLEYISRVRGLLSMARYFASLPWTGKTAVSNNINATCAAARPVDAARLRAAIAFEFDLPYPDGTRMDLVKSAMDSFSKRLQITL